MLITFIFVIFLLAAFILLIALLADGIRLLVRHIKKLDKKQIMHRIKKKMSFLISICALCIAFIWVTQITASTPVIRDKNGKKVEGSIAKLTQVTLNGRKEWISIRG